MSQIYVLVEHAGRRLDACSLMALRQARRLAEGTGDMLCAVTFVESGEDASDLVAVLGEEGVDELVALLSTEPASREGVDHLATELDIRNARLVISPATPESSLTAVRIGARLAMPVIADCVGINVDGSSTLKFEIATAGGMAWVEALPAGGVPAIVLMPLRELDWSTKPTTSKPRVRVVNIDTPAAEAEVKLVERVNVRKEDMTLAEASIIVSGGRGLGGPEGFEPLTKLAGLLGAHVGASRVATDLGWIDREHLVGMSGSTVRPALYLAIGISGAPHHLMGMRDSTTIVALNTDENAPIMKLADHAFVGDVNDVVPKLISLLGG